MGSLCPGHEVPVDQNWLYNNFRETEFAYEPGTEFLYNNAPATLLASVIRKKTGLSLPEMIYTSYVLLSGYFSTPDTFHVIFRWAETGFVKQLNFHFTGSTCTVTDQMIRGRDKDSKTTVYKAI